jgi:hypothetical protein
VGPPTSLGTSTSSSVNAGDVFIIPRPQHAYTTTNHLHLHYARVITIPNVNLARPFNLNRPDGDYERLRRRPPTPTPPSSPFSQVDTPADHEKTLREELTLHALIRESTPEYKPKGERLALYPHTAFYNREKVEAELKRMITDAKATVFQRSRSTAYIWAAKKRSSSTREGTGTTRRGGATVLPRRRRTRGRRSCPRRRRTFCSERTKLLGARSYGRGDRARML